MNRMSVLVFSFSLLFVSAISGGTLKSFSGIVKTLDAKRGSVVVRTVEGDEKKFIYLESMPGANSFVEGGQVSVFYDDETGIVKRFVATSNVKKSGSVKQATPTKRSSSKLLSDGAATKSDSLTAKNVGAFAERSTSAKDAVILYQAVLSNPSTPKEDQSILEKDLAKWQEDAEKDLHRVGKEWLDKDEAQKRRQDSVRLMAEAITVLDASSTDLAIERLKDAGKLDPDNPNVKCWEGLLLAVIQRDFKNAARSFEDGLAVAPKDPSLLNNLALCEIRLRKYSDAIDHWSASLSLSPSSQHISQNVGRFIKLANNKNLKMFRGVDERTIKKALDVYARSKRAGDSADIGTGFFYVIPAERVPGGKPAPASDELSDLVAGFGSGFVVAPEIIATNYHVVDGASGLLVTSAELSQDGQPAQVLATDPARDIAIIRCPGLKLKPLTLSPTLNRGKQIAVFGYPEPTVLGNTLKMTDGIVTSLPDVSTGNNFLHSAIANHGNSGGPICDSTGAVVGILNAFFTVDIPICSGIPAQALLDLLKQQGIQNAAPANAAVMSLEQLDNAVSKSVVQIRILGAQANKQIAGKLTLEDDSCLICDASGKISCPNKECKRGVVMVNQTVTVGRGLDGSPLTQTQSVEQSCRTCKGTGKLSCPLCRGDGR